MYKYRPTYSPGKNHTALTHAYANQVYAHINTQRQETAKLQICLKSLYKKQKTESFCLEQGLGLTLKVGVVR